MKRLCCLLTGGHRYEDKNIESYQHPDNFWVTLRNVCVKCGKPIEFDFPIGAYLLKEMKKEKRKIKAIYAHIAVTGDIDKPYYSIQWYDINEKTMVDGYGSYELKYVRQWLQDNFEIVDRDIDIFINRQNAEIERLEKQSNVLAKRFYKEGIQDLAQKLKEKAYIPKPYGMKEVVDVCEIDELVIVLGGEKRDADGIE